MTDSIEASVGVRAARTAGIVRIVGDLQLDIGGTVRLNVAAQQQGVAAQLVHKRKFAPGAFHIGGELAAAGAFKITKRLKKRDF